jgi:uncharacterized membrane protein
MMRQFDDPDQAVSWAAVLIFIGAIWPVAALLQDLFAGTASFTNLFYLLFFASVVGQIVGAAFLLKQRRWAWPLTVAAVGVGALFDLLRLPLQPFNGLFSLLFAGLVLYLLFRPAVRERFGVGRR